MHKSIIKIGKHLKMLYSLCTALKNAYICTETERKQMECHKARIKQNEVENEDNEKEYIENFGTDIIEANAHEDVSYYVENGLRKVYPYYFTYRTFAKERWVGHKLLDVLQHDFRAASAEEYTWRFESGAVTVNNEQVDMDYRLKAQDYIQNTIHRHEAPVIHAPLQIIHLDKDVLVINKPASVPVHPCGLYRYNSVLFILAKEYNLKNVRSIHRLDRLTSGLLIFGRTREIAQALAHQVRNRQVKKEYVCRVEGEFPDKVVECAEPVEAIDSKMAVGKVSADGKPSLTVFEKLSYNGKSSVLLCRPTTGRMHQIRIHLQFLGYPILNDSLYNHQYNIAQVPLEQHLAELTSTVERDRNHQDEKSTALSQFDQHCWDCKFPAADPHLSDLVIYLHAWKYQGKGWSYKTELPDWAHENWLYG